MWYETHDNLVALARWFLAEENYTATEIVDFFAKPWRYTGEWTLYQDSMATA